MTNKNFEVENAKKKEAKQKSLGKMVSFFIGFVSLMAIIFSICTIVYGYFHLKAKYQSATYEQNSERKTIYDRMYGFGDGLYYNEQAGNPLIYAKAGELLPIYDLKSMSRSIVTEMSLWAGMAGILTGLIGFLSIKYNKIYYSCTFGCLAMMIGIMLIVTGALNLEYGDLVMNTYSEICVNNREEAEEIRLLRSQNIDQVMCTERCPCWSGFQIREGMQGNPINEDVNIDNLLNTRSIVAMWTGFKGFDENYLNKFNRTSEQAVKYIYANEGDVYREPIFTMKPFTWADYIYDLDGTQVSYRSFKECFEKVLLPNAFLQTRERSNLIGVESTTELEFDNKQYFYQRNGLFTYFSQLEKEFGCNSICEPNLFFINKDLEEGVPHSECLKAPSEAWGQSNNVINYGRIGSALAITAGVFMILAAFCSVQKCNGFGQENLKRRYKFKDNYV